MTHDEELDAALFKAMFVSQDTMHARVQMVKSLCRTAHFEEAAKQADAFAEGQEESIKKAETDDERNQLEHGNWVAGMIALRIRHRAAHPEGK